MNMYLMELGRLDPFSFLYYESAVQYVTNQMSQYHKVHQICLTFISSSNHLIFVVFSKHDI